MSSLAAKKILVTRALAQSSELVSKLEAKNAVPLLYPCLEIHFEPLPQFNLNEYDWLIFTSQNSVKAFSNIELPESLNIARIHPKTYPDSKALAQFFENKTSQKILLPQGNLADHRLGEALMHSGHKVTRILAYHTGIGTGGIQLGDHVLDAITFTSPSAAKYFLLRSNLSPLQLLERGLGGEVIACIGTTTYQAAKELGFQNVLCAKEPSLDGLIKILEDYFNKANSLAKALRILHAGQA